MFSGGHKGPQILERAKAVEAAIYRIVGALLAPWADEIESKIVERYRPFEVMEFIQLDSGAAQQTSSASILRLLVFLDDAHFLHGAQLEHLKAWLIRRELTIGRWILSRLDVLQPKELFDTLSFDDADVNMPGITTGRDIIRINLQSTRRNESRRNFRAMAHRSDFAGLRSSGQALQRTVKCAARCGVTGAAPGNSPAPYLPLVERVMAQTQARVFEAKRHYPEKILAESGSSVAGSAGILGGL